MYTQTLILNSKYQPHNVVDWKDAVTKMFSGSIEVLVQYDEVLAHLDRQTFNTFPKLKRALRQVIGTDVESMEIKVPAVAVIRRKLGDFKTGVKFSRTNVCLRDDFTCQYCLAPDHKVLTSDLRWVPLGDVKIADTLVGFEEFRTTDGGRRFIPSVVTSHEFSEDLLYQVVLEDGTVFKATKEHRWLGRSKQASSLRWFETKNLLGKRLPKLFDVWGSDTSYSSGWLSGLLDGEGWISSRSGLQVALAQNSGLVLDRIKSELESRSLQYSLGTVSGTCQRVNILGSTKDKAELLGTVRPVRLLNEFKVGMLGRIQAKDYLKVISVTPIGIQKIVKMATSSGTFLAEGFPHHNCGDKLPMTKLNYDHVIPRAQGGQTVWTNIVASCYACNTKKADNTPAEAGMPLLSVPTRPQMLPMTGFQFDRSKAPEEWLPFLNVA